MKRPKKDSDIEVDWRPLWDILEGHLSNESFAEASESVTPLFQALEPAGNISNPVRRKKSADLVDIFVAMFDSCFAFFKNGEFERSLRNCRNLLGVFVQNGLNDNRSNGLVIGNPFFHLLVAKNLLALGASDAEMIEEIIRCCAIGGVEMLSGEPHRLKELLETLDPPAPYATWDESAENPQKTNSCWMEYPFQKVAHNTALYKMMVSKWGPNQK